MNQVLNLPTHLLNEPDDQRIAHGEISLPLGHALGPSIGEAVHALALDGGQYAVPACFRVLDEMTATVPRPLRRQHSPARTV